MFLFLGLIFILWIEYLLIAAPRNNRPAGRAGNLSYCWLAGLQLFCLMGFRSVNVAHDTYAYFNKYIYIANMPLVYDQGYTEIGFRLLCKGLHYFSDHPQIMFIVTSAFVVFAVMRLIYKYAPNTFWGVFVYITFGRFLFELGGVRQALAMAIAVFAFDAVLERRFLKFFLLIAFASLFHVSAWLLLIMYPLYKLRLGEKLIFGVLLLSVILFFMTPFLSEMSFSFFTRYSGYREFERDSLKTLSVITVAINAIMLVLGWFAWKMKLRVQRDFPHTREGKIFEYLYILYLTGFCFYIPALHMRSFMRIAVYFDFFNIIFIPCIFALLRKDLMRSVIITAMLAFIILENYVVIKYRPDWNYIAMYEPFWQNMEGSRDKLREAMAYVEAR